MNRPPPRSTLFPYTTLFRSDFGLCTPAATSSWTPPITSCWPTPSPRPTRRDRRRPGRRSEEHTSELQSHVNLVCRLLLEKKKREGDVRAKHSRDRSTTPELD